MRRLSLKAKLILNYLVVLAIGGLATSVVGSWIVSSTIMAQARRSVDRVVATARALYDQQLESIQRTILLTASGMSPGAGFRAADLDAVRRQAGLDFLGVADARGRVLLRTTSPFAGDDVSGVAEVGAALRGSSAAGTEIVPAAFLAAEDAALAARARTRIVRTEHAAPPLKPDETAGMVLIVAAPVRSAGGALSGALYGGVLLNRNSAIVDRAWELLFKGDRFENEDVGSVTLFQGEARISTNVRTAAGQRAIGTQASTEVRRAVLDAGRSWRGRAFVVKDWYISGYDPIRNQAGQVIGMLYVGLLERAYTATRDRVIVSFFGIASIGFILIIAITYYEVRKITLPLGRMAEATRSIAAGRFDEEVDSRAQGEIAQLAESFNVMLKSLRQMRGDLEEWGRTLEQKVKQRTEELAAMQARVAQSERLASIGMLAAGVAHEINNPLGGILSLTALSLEDLAPGDPNRENLEVVLQQAERCRDIVRGLLEFSRQSAPRTERLDLGRVLEETLALITNQAAFHNVNLVRRYEEDLPAFMGDKSQLEQVFMNIVINAVQAMEERGTLTISTWSAGGWIEAAIEDTGCGIPPEQVDQVFDPFFTTKASGHGTGLGLSIAYGIVTSHGGSISVASEVGRGSRFTVRLPAAESAAAEAKPGQVVST